MTVTVHEAPITALESYATIPIAFQVGSVFDVTEQTREKTRFTLMERRLDRPYLKDYDAIHGEGPTRWAQQFDVSHWGILVAWLADQRVGGAVVAFDTPSLHMLEGRLDLAVLWDIRVAEEARGQGVGSALFQAAERWARARGCHQLKVETQNINVGACKFYARQGCILTTVNRSAYPELPDEIQLLWTKDL